MDAGEEKKEESGRSAEDAPEKEPETRDDSDGGEEEDEDEKPAAEEEKEESGRSAEDAPEEEQETRGDSDGGEEEDEDEKPAAEEEKEDSGRPAEHAPEKEQETRGDSDEGGEEEDEDEKHAAKKPGEKSAGVASDDNDNNDDSASSNSSSEDDEGKEESESKSEAYVTEDGRTLSEYEIQRLERIKRNRAYLAQLGLAGKDGGGVLGKKKKKERPRKAATDEKPVIRRVSRRSRVKTVTYTEPSASVRDLLRVADKKATNAPVDLKLTSPEKADMGTQEVEPPKQPPPSNKPKKRSVNDRQEQFVYLEFLSIRSSKNQSLRQAKQNVRTAEKEVKYWHKLVQRWERRKQRQSEAQRQRQTEVRERAELGGNSIKEVLQEIDSRMPEIAETVKRYDDLLQVRFRIVGKRGDACRAVSHGVFSFANYLTCFGLLVGGDQRAGERFSAFGGGTEIESSGCSRSISEGDEGSYPALFRPTHYLARLLCERSCARSHLISCCCRCSLGQTERRRFTQCHVSRACTERPTASSPKQTECC